MAFDIRRGTNISHWLSQSDRRGQPRREFFGRRDVELIAGLGFDHLRIPVDEEQLWDEAASPDEEAFGLLDSALDWCAACGLRAIVDLHILRSHHFNIPERPLWHDAACRERFLDCWRELSRRLAGRDAASVACELLNEPVAEDPDDWNRVSSRAIGVLRELEPERTIFLGSNRCNSPDAFDVLTVPPGDGRLVLAFHLYEPFGLTHHEASWTPLAFYRGPVHYPGRTIEEADMKGLGDAERAVLESVNGVFDRDALAALLAKPLAARERTGLAPHCGEFGCLPTVPVPDRMRWYADVISIFDEHGIAWANWDYKGSFGIVGADREVHRELVDVL